MTGNNSPFVPDAAYQQVVAFYRQGQFGAAEQLCRDILGKQPAHFGALHVLGVLQARDGDPTEGLRLLGLALAVDANSAAARNHRGTILLGLGRTGEAAADFECAVANDATFAEAFYNLGFAQQSLGNIDDALTSYEKAAALEPGYFEAHTNLGALLQRVKRFEEARACFDKAIALQPKNADLVFNRGCVLQEAGRFAEALESFDAAIALKPHLAEAFYNRGEVLRMLGRMDEALASLDQALALNPDYAEAACSRFYIAGVLCDWRGRVRWVDRLVSLCMAEQAVAPFVMLGVTDSPQVQFHAGVAAGRTHPAQPPIIRARAPSRPRVHIGYISADFRDHPVAHLMAGLMEQHDRQHFEISAISLNTTDHSLIRRRLEKAADRFLEITGLSDIGIAQLMVGAGIDIAVDLNGYTQNARPGIFAYRPAPIAVNYLGFAGTRGANYIDYIIADSYVIPDAAREYFSESVVTLPDTYLVTEAAPPAPGPSPTRADAGLPDGAIVFCGFNNGFKITPGMFDVWARLLLGVEGSVLWLNLQSEIAMGNLRREANARGLNPSRLVFASREPDHARYLSLLALADVFLDTAPYNAHSTAADALGACVPVVTCPGQSFASRVAASLLHAIGAADLIAPTMADYERLTLELARDSRILGMYKRRLASRRATHPLFDTARFTRHLEQAYATMWSRHEQGLKPEGFAVESIAP